MFKNLQYWKPVKKESLRHESIHSLTKKVTRRAAVGLLVATAYCLAPSMIPDAGAMMFHGGVAIPSPQTQMTTVTLANNTGVSETPQISRTFGLGFPDSDVTGCPLVGGNTSYPQFKISGTNVPYSMSLFPTLHPSGRLAHATFVAELGGNFVLGAHSNTSIAAYQSVNTSLPTPSGRSLSEAAGANLQHLVTGLDHLTGNYVATLNDGVADAFSDNYVWIDGAAGKGGRLRARYKQAGVAHGNLEAYIYYMLGSDGSGHYAGIQFMWCLATPFVDNNSLTNFLSFSAMTLQTGSTVIRDNVTAGRSNTQNFTWTSGSSLNAVNNVIEAGQLGRLTTTGTLPTGLSTGVSYWANHAGSSAYAPPFSTFNLTANSCLGGGVITPTGAGSGTHTFTAYPFINAYSRLYMCGTTAQWDYVQGSGSTPGVSTYVMTNVQVTFNNVWWRKTMLIPSYDFTPVVTSPTAQAFYINTCGGLLNAPNTTGPSSHIGLLPLPVAAYIYTMKQADETNMRLIGLMSGQSGCTLRNLAQGGTLMAWNKGHNGSGTPYAGMGTLRTNNIYGVNNSGNIFTPTNSAQSYVNILGVNNWDFSHRTAFNYGAWLFTGEWQYLDQGIEQSIAGIAGQLATSNLSTSKINATNWGPLGISTDSSYANVNSTAPNGTPYYRVLWQGKQVRAAGWQLRDIAYFACITPQAFPECPAYRTFLNDVIQDSMAHWLSCLSTLYGFNSFAQTMGFMTTSPANVFTDFWQEGFIADALAMYYGMTGNANAATLVGYFNAKIAWFVNNMGTSALAQFETLPLKSSAQLQGAVATQVSSLGSVVEGAFDWTSSPSQATLNTTAMATPTLSVNDIILFSDLLIPSTAPTIPLPAGISAFTPMYVVSVSGSGVTKTIQLSTTLGGSPFVFTDNSAVSHTIFWQAASPLPLANPGGASSHIVSVPRATFLAQSRGIAMDPTADAAITAVTLPATTGNFGTFPNYCFAKAA